jgi:hypothetical protein
VPFGCGLVVFVFRSNLQYVVNQSVLQITTEVWHEGEVHHDVVAQSETRVVLEVSVLVSSLCIIEIEIAISQSTAKPTSSIIESFSDRKRSTAWPFHGGRISEIKIATAKSRFTYIESSSK